MKRTTLKISNYINLELIFFFFCTTSCYYTTNNNNNDDNNKARIHTHARTNISLLNGGIISMCVTVDSLF